MDPPGLRRLRFPFFDSLVKERLERRGRDAQFSSRCPVVVETRLITQSTRESLVFNPEIACPLSRTNTWRTKPPT
jgi:hypothetical protein